MDQTEIAKVCHQANKAYCELHGDHSQQDWDSAEEWQRESAIKGVAFRLENPEATPAQQHQEWCDQKVADGWVYGEEKDSTKKTHPCLVRYDELPASQRKKDALFQAVVDALK